MHLVDAENTAGGQQLLLPDLGQPRARGLFGHVRVDDGGELAVGAADVARRDPAIGAQREHPTHRDGLVVRVGMHRHQAEAVVLAHSSAMVTERMTSPGRTLVTTSMPLIT